MRFLSAFGLGALLLNLPVSARAKCPEDGPPACPAVNNGAVDGSGNRVDDTGDTTVVKPGVGGNDEQGDAGADAANLFKIEAMIKTAERSGAGDSFEPSQIIALIGEIRDNRTRERYNQRFIELMRANLGKHQGEGNGGLGDGGNQNQGKFDPRREVYRDWANRKKEKDPKNPANWTESAEVACMYRDYQSCFFDAGRAIELGAADAKTYATYGSAANNLGDYKLAYNAAAKALELDANNASAKALASLSQGRVGKTSLPSVIGGASTADVAAALGGTPGEAAAAASAVSAGGFAPGSNPTHAAEAAARQATAVMAAFEKSAALTKQAAASLAVQDYNQAHDNASKAIEMNNQNAQAWNYRAIANNKLGRYTAAVYDASYALALAPGSTPALQSRSWAFNKMGKYRDGLADANYTLEREPNNPFAYQNRAFSLAGLGERDGMMQSLKRSAELDARFQDRYQAALQTPESGDMLFLFDDAPAAQAGAPKMPAPAPKKKRFVSLIVLVLSGGALVALGLLHTFSSTFRETMRTTLRRSGGAAKGGLWTQYELQRELGIGGMGVVYQARDTSLDRPVAIKKMRDEIRLDRRERDRFVQEAKTVASLHHPNIVDIYSIVEEDGEVYLIFEYAEGRPLSAVLQESGTLPLAGAVKLIKDAAAAVDYAHRSRIIHRDIKPSNIMVGPDGSAKVMDFGVARQAKEAVTRQLTNTVVGTPPYMAPEQEQGNVRPESDVYALGVCFYEMLSGKLPFQGQGAGMLLNKLNGRCAPLSETAKGLPAGMDAVMSKVLAPDPDRRYRSAGEFIAALEALGPAAG